MRDYPSSRTCVFASLLLTDSHKRAYMVSRAMRTAERPATTDQPRSIHHMRNSYALMAAAILASAGADGLSFPSLMYTGGPSVGARRSPGGRAHHNWKRNRASGKR